jgi:nucleotide-binding universal stress UspA family protein
MPTVAHLMTLGPLVIEKHQSLTEASGRMEIMSVRHLPVIDGSKLVGMLSEGDILRLRLLRPEASPDVLSVADAMSRDPFTVAPDALASEVARAMAERKIGAAVVVDEGRIAGIFTTSDALRALGDPGAAAAGTTGTTGTAVTRFARILCPVDFSEASRDAVVAALELARAAGGTVTLFHAADLSFGGFGEAVWEGPDVLRRIDRRVEGALREWQEEYARQGGVEVGSARASGAPWEAITRHARETAVDLIVIATHGRTGLKRVLMGSVVEAVVRHAPCPVLVVRRKAGTS